MRKTLLAAIAAAIASVGLAAPPPASADGVKETAAPAKAARVYRTQYVRGLWPGGPDPYAYAYARTRYYPYYDSDYWVPRSEMRYRTRYPNRLPEYWSSWGYPLSCKQRGERNCGVPYARGYVHDRH